MKTIILSFILMAGLISTSHAQLNLLNKIEKESKKRVDKNVDKGIDKGLDTVEEGVEDAVTGKNADESDKTNEPANDRSPSSDARPENTSSDDNTDREEKEETEEAPQLVWSKYDFVPGDKVIFEDILFNEENGEFPSRWDLVKGTIENAEFGGENVIMFRGGSSTIIPYLKNMDIDYLPEVFTVEFDLYLPGSVVFTVLFYDAKNQRSPSNYSSLKIWPGEMIFHPASSKIPDKGSISKEWAHIAIAYTNGKMKAYINETRLINIPHLPYDPTGISLHAYHASDVNRYYIRNIRIAEGGVKYYDRVLQDGKIVSNGIRFDVGKATLRPESMGVINKIYDLMDEHPDLNFSVEGHTDSDGDEASNQSLSKARAETVMNTLVQMGIAKNRLTSKGFGESRPIDNNATAEGKANNRRVEFVKL
ncbi:MAG: OmpA family protein [Bacteroidales bacterium]|jgi:outer membrane protein OmpA-like peptidoglycan-associated protein